uniref:hypothetical protein n=1 Tax=Escherichia coli TaxID=562 RepID=UPI001962659D
FLTLQDYEKKAFSVIQFQSPKPSSEMITKQHQLQFLQNVLEVLAQDLQSLKETLIDRIWREGCSHRG